MKANISIGLAVLMVAVLVLAIPQLAMAAGADTNYGTTITNSVTIQYGSGPSTITTTTSVDFVVDRVLDWTIAPSIAPTLGVFPGSTGNAIAFSVQNSTNGPVDIILAFPASVPAPSTVTLYADDGGTPGVFDSTDTPLPPGGPGFYLDEVAEDAAPTVFMVVDVPAGATTSDVYAYEITATVREAGGAGPGAVLNDDSGSANNSTLVQNVYNDGVGYTGGTGDTAGDGFYRAYAAFQVVVPSLTATKTAVITSDPVNGASNPKAIPGATVHYTISVTNTGTATATAVNVTDNIPVGTTHLAGPTVTNGGGGETSAYLPGPPAQITVTGANIPIGVTMTVEFDVTID